MEISRPLIEAGQHELQIDLPSEPIGPDADPERWSQALVNILDNAAKYTAHGCEIGLPTRHEGPHVMIRVKDNGIGVPADSLDTIFDLFARVDDSLERAQGGLGIDLILSGRGFVAMYGGSAAFSEGAGHGGEFVVRLAVMGEQARRVEHARSGESLCRQSTHGASWWSTTTRMERKA